MQYVDVKVHNDVATILIDRPQKRNALSPQAIEDLQLAFSDVHQEKRARAVVLTGAGDHFCAGLDLAVMNEVTQLPVEESFEQWLKLWGQFTELIEQMLRFPKPIICAVDGAAVGGGLALALASDVILASQRATFQSVAGRRGLVAGATSALLCFRLGSAIAARMALLGAPVDSKEAYRVGLCSSVVDSDQIWVAASTMASQVSNSPHEAIQATKKVINEVVGEALLTQLQAVAADSATACTTESATEGIQAFNEAREPKWP